MSAPHSVSGRTPRGAAMPARPILGEQHPLASLVEPRRSNVDDLARHQRERTALRKYEIEARRRLSIPSTPLRDAFEDDQAAAHPARLRSADHVGDAVHLGWLEAKAIEHASVPDKSSPPHLRQYRGRDNSCCAWCVHARIMSAGLSPVRQMRWSHRGNGIEHRRRPPGPEDGDRSRASTTTVRPGASTCVKPSLPRRFSVTRAR
jgi:hypothetical protein